MKFPATFVPRAPTAAVRTIPGTDRPWPLDKRGQPWPRSRFGQPLRPLDEYPPGVRAPGEAYAGPIADPGKAIKSYLEFMGVLGDPGGSATGRDPLYQAYLDGQAVAADPGKYAGYGRPETALSPGRAPSQAERDVDAIRAGMDRARAAGTGGGMRVAANTARTMSDAAPPPLDPRRPFVVGENYDRARRRVRDMPPRAGSPGVAAPVLPVGNYQPGLDNLVRRIAGARPGDEAQLRRDIQEIYQQPGANRTGEILQRALTDALDAGDDLRARQAILSGIAPVARVDPEALAGQEFGLPGWVLGGVVATPGKLAGGKPAAQLGDKPASTPIGRMGNPVDVTPGTNQPAIINGRTYTGHGLDQMQGRGVTTSVVESAIQNGRTKPGNTPGTTVHYGNNGVVVVIGERGQIITVISR